MPIITGKPASAAQLFNKLLRLQQMNPNGFRQPRQRAGGFLTLTEKTGEACGALSFEELRPDLSERQVKKRVRRKIHLAVLAEQRRLGGKISLGRERAIGAEIRRANDAA